jgi:RimJ/RimL family protein N-acetyltransferase
VADFNLATERFALRPLTDEHLEALKAILADPEIIKTLLGDVSTPQGLEAETHKWIDDAPSWQKNGFGSWGIFDRGGAFGAADALLGLAAAGEATSPSAEGPEIFYFIKRACWGKGVAWEAVRRICRYLFQDLGVPALDATIFAEANPGSVRLAEKLGMRPAGRVSLRDHGLDDARLQELVDFDLWRLRSASGDRLQLTLEEAAFRIGQTLAEGLGALAGRSAEIREALAARGAETGGLAPGQLELIDQQLAQGMKAKGMALYRVHRRDFTGEL